jgi:hypothetical protein
MRSLLSLCLVAAALSAAEARAEAPSGARVIRYAIVVGNNAPPDEEIGRLSPLRYADDDAIRYAALFRAYGAEVRLFTVPDEATQRRYPELNGQAEPPNLPSIRAAVSALAERIKRDRAAGHQVVFYFAFSGHGAESQAQEPYLALLGGMLTRQVLYDEILAALPATYAHLFIDACHAGAVVGVRGGDFFAGREESARTASVAPTSLVARPEEALRTRFPSVGVVLASTADQETHEWSAIEGGVFTHELLSALLGAADINGDQRIEYSEVQAFIAAANREIDDVRALPRVLAYPPPINLNVALVSLDALVDSAVLHGRAGKLGHFRIELSNGQRYLDAHLAPEQAVVLALPAHGTAFVRTAGHEAELELRPGKELAIEGLRLVPESKSARGSVDRSLRSGLFASTYDAGYYKGFVDSVGAVGVDFRAAEQLRASAGVSPARVVSIGLLVTAAAATAVSIYTGVQAARAQRAFDDEPLAGPAAEHAQRFQQYSAAAWGTGIGAGLCTALAIWVWPSTSVLSLSGGPAPGQGWSFSLQGDF